LAECDSFKAIYSAFYVDLRGRGATRIPQPAACIPIPCVLKSRTLYPTPYTLDPKPETRNP